jgi:hypothetical protein
MKKVICIVLLMNIFISNIYAQYIRDDELNIVFDTSTMLVWEDTAFTGSIKEALDHCKELDIGLFKDWRLPTYNELYSIVDLTQARPALDTVFKDRALHYYWTSSLYANTHRPWSIDFTTGGNHYNININNPNNIRCVHSFY